MSGKQRHSKVFKVTTFCLDTRFQSFSPLVNCIVHHALLKFKPLPQLVRMGDWYSIDTHGPVSCPRRGGNLPGLDQDCWLATIMSGLTVSLEREVPVHCFAGKETCLSQFMQFCTLIQVFHFTSQNTATMSNEFCVEISSFRQSRTFLRHCC